MSQRPAPGRTFARDADSAFDEEGRPSKSQLKRESLELQTLGVELTEMSAARLADCAMPENLRDAIHELHRTRSHEGKRRQIQYIGKLMRQAEIEPLREAVAAAKLGTARDALQLHQAEQWRTELISDPEALTRWVAQFPQSDLQRLRSLVRAAQAEQRAEPGAGQAPRQLRSYRELFQWLKQELIG